MIRYQIEITINKKLSCLNLDHENSSRIRLKEENLKKLFNVIKIYSYRSLLEYQDGSSHDRSV